MGTVHQAQVATATGTTVATISTQLIARMALMIAISAVAMTGSAAEAAVEAASAIGADETAMSTPLPLRRLAMAAGTVSAAMMTAAGETAVAVEIVPEMAETGTVIGIAKVDGAMTTVVSHQVVGSTTETTGTINLTGIHHPVVALV